MRGPVLVIDGECGFCTRSVRVAGRLLRRMPPVVAWQDADLAGYGLDARRAADAVQWVGPDGAIAEGAAAVAALLIWRRGPYAVVGHLLAAPGVRWLAAVVYRVVSAHRSRLPGGTGTCAL